MIYPKIEQRKGDVLVQVTDLCAPRLHPASFVIKAGEVLDVSGLGGSGKSRLFRTIMGLYPRTSGSVALRDHDISREIFQAGVYHLSPDRTHESLDLAKSSKETLVLNPMMARHNERLRGFVNWSAIGRATDTIADNVEMPKGYRRKFVS